MPATTTPRRRSADLIPPREEILKALTEAEEEAEVLRGLPRLAHRRDTTPEQRARLREVLAGGKRHAQ